MTTEPRTEAGREIREWAKDVVRGVPAVHIRDTEAVPTFKRRVTACIDRAAVILAFERAPLHWKQTAEAAQGVAPRAEGSREHLTDEDDPLACWCGPYRDTEEPEVIIHRKEGEA